MKTITLTTPLTHGEQVKELQQALAAKGYFKSPTGGFDGVYGQLTAQAVYRAKFWLGYAKPDHVAGDPFMGYLEGDRKLTLKMHLLRERRINQAKKATKKKPMRVKALENAITHLGQKEYPPDSNRVPWASLWYGVVGSWCAMAVTRWYVDAGSKAFVRGRKYAYVPYIVEDARAGRNHLTITHNPLPGNVVAYDWPGESKGIADHTGLFEKWVDEKAGTFQAIEGNTGHTNQSDGGEVMRQNRTLSEVQCFISVGA